MFFLFACCCLFVVACFLLFVTYYDVILLVVCRLFVLASFSFGLDVLNLLCFKGQSIAMFLFGTQPKKLLFVLIFSMLQSLSSSRAGESPEPQDAARESHSSVGVGYQCCYKPRLLFARNCDGNSLPGTKCDVNVELGFNLSHLETKLNENGLMCDHSETKLNDGVVLNYEMLQPMVSSRAGESPEPQDAARESHSSVGVGYQCCYRPRLLFARNCDGNRLTGMNCDVNMDLGLNLSHLETKLNESGLMCDHSETKLNDGVVLNNEMSQPTMSSRAGESPEPQDAARESHSMIDLADRLCYRPRLLCAMENLDFGNSADIMTMEPELNVDCSETKLNNCPPPTLVEYPKLARSSRSRVFRAIIPDCTDTTTVKTLFDAYTCHHPSFQPSCHLCTVRQLAYVTERERSLREFYEVMLKDTLEPPVEVRRVNNKYTYIRNLSRYRRFVCAQKGIPFSTKETHAAYEREVLDSLARMDNELKENRTDIFTTRKHRFQLNEREYQRICKRQFDDEAQNDYVYWKPKRTPKKRKQIWTYPSVLDCMVEILNGLCPTVKRGHRVYVDNIPYVQDFVLPPSNFDGSRARLNRLAWKQIHAHIKDVKTHGPRNFNTGPIESLTDRASTIVADRLASAFNPKIETVLSEISATNSRVNCSILDLNEKALHVLDSFDFANIFRIMQKEFTPSVSGFAMSVGDIVADLGAIIMNIINCIKTEEEFTLTNCITQIINIIRRYVAGWLDYAFNLDAISGCIKQLRSRFAANCDGGNIQSSDEESPHLVAALGHILTSSLFDANSPFAKGSRFVVNFDNYIVRGTHLIEWFVDLFNKLRLYIEVEILHKDLPSLINSSHADMSIFLSESTVLISFLRNSNDSVDDSLERKELYARLMRTYKLGLKIEKDLVVIGDPKVTRYFMSIFRVITDLHTSHIGASARSCTRIEPFSLGLVGAPGVGKTWLFSTLYKDVRSAMGDPLLDVQSEIYINNPTSEYHDSYTGQEVFVFDDMYQFRVPELLSAENALFNQLKGSQPYRLNCAEISNKTTTYFCSKILLSTLNAVPSEYVVGDTVLLQPTSAIRRFDLLITFIPLLAVRPAKPDKHALYGFLHNDAFVKCKDRRTLLRFDVHDNKFVKIGNYDYDGLVSLLAHRIDLHMETQRSLSAAIATPSELKPLEDLYCVRRMRGQIEAGGDHPDTIDLESVSIEEFMCDLMKTSRSHGFIDSVKKILISMGNEVKSFIALWKETINDYIVHKNYIAFNMTFDVFRAKFPYISDSECVLLYDAFSNGRSSVRSKDREFLYLPDVKTFIDLMPNASKITSTDSIFFKDSETHKCIVNMTRYRNEIECSVRGMWKDYLASGDNDVTTFWERRRKELTDQQERDGGLKPCVAYMTTNRLCIGECDCDHKIHRVKNCYCSNLLRCNQWNHLPAGGLTTSVQTKFCNFDCICNGYKNIEISCLCNGGKCFDFRHVTTSLCSCVECIIKSEYVYIPFPSDLPVCGSVSPTCDPAVHYMQNSLSFTGPFQDVPHYDLQVLRDVQVAMGTFKLHRFFVYSHIRDFFETLFGPVHDILTIFKNKIVSYFDFTKSNSFLIFTERFLPLIKMISTMFVTVAALVFTGIGIKRGVKYVANKLHSKEKNVESTTLLDTKRTNIRRFAAESLELSGVPGKRMRRFATENMPDRVVEHAHNCPKCNRVFTHIHPMTSLDHEIYEGECAYTDCVFYSQNNSSSIVNVESLSKERILAIYNKSIDASGHEKYILDLSGGCESVTDIGANDINTIVKANTFRVRNLTVGRSSNGFMIGGTIFLCNYHAIPSVDDEFRVGGNFKIKELTVDPMRLRDLPKGSFFIDKQKDLLLINFSYLKNLSPYRNILNLFIKRDDFKFGDLRSLLFSPPIYKSGSFEKDPCESYNNMTCTNIVVHEKLEFGTYGEGFLNSIVGYVSYYVESKPGDCGSALIINNTAFPRKILGIHVAGGSFAGSGVCNLLTQEYMVTVIAHVSNGSIQGVDYPVVPPFEENKFSIFDNSNSGDIEIIGTLPNGLVPRSPSKTKLIKTIMFEKIYESHVAPAVLNNRGGVDPLRKGILPVAVPDEPVNFNDLLIATDCVSNHINTFDSPYYKCGLLSDFENLNGRRGDPRIPPIDLNTSAGYPFSIEVGAHGKHLLVEGDIDTGFTLRADVAEIVATEETALKCGGFNTVMFVDTKKDEKRDLAKVAASNTRIFQNCNFTANYLLRKYFQNFIAHCYYNCVNGPYAIGINPHSEDWSNLWKRLILNSDNFIAGDFSKFDKKIPYVFFLAACKVVNDFYNDDNSLIRENLICSVVSGFHVCGNSVYRSHHGMPSGIVLTAVINSVIDSLMFRVAFISLSRDALCFGDYVKLNSKYHSLVVTSFYGDDHVITVSDSISSFFNMINISSFFKKIGMDYTTNVKENIVDCFIPVRDVTYLKRKFSFVEGRWCAPLDFASLSELWNWMHDGGDSVNNFLQSITCFFQELSHYTQDIWEREYLRCRTACIVMGVHIPVFTYQNCRRVQFGWVGEIQSLNEAVAFDKDAQVDEKQITGFTDQSDTLMHKFFSFFRPPASTNPYSEPSIVEFLSRPYVIDSVTWDPAATGVLAKISFPYALFNLKPIWDKLSNFEFFRYESVECEFRVNGTNFHKGDVLITNVPQYYNGVSTTVASLYDTAYSLFPNAVILSANNSQVVSVKFPYIHQRQYISLSSYNDPLNLFERAISESAFMRMFVLNGVSPIAVHITITARFIKPEIAGNDAARSTFAAPAFPNSVENTALATGLSYTGPVGQIQSEADIKVSADSVSSQLAAPNPLDCVFDAITSTVAKGVGSLVSSVPGALLAAFGMQKPMIADVHTRILTFGHSLAHTRGMDYGQLLSVDPENKIGSMAFAMGGSTDDMIIAKQISKYGILYRGLIAPGNEPGFPVFGCYVAPLVVPVTRSTTLGDTVYHTPLSYFASMFAFWRGSLKYRIRICCTCFHTLRFRVTWHPKIDSASTDLDRLINDTNAVSHIVDVNATTEFVFEIPYLSEELYLPVTMDVQASGENSYLPSNGYLSISIVIPLNYSSRPIPDVDINVFVAAGSDFVLAKPSSQYLAPNVLSGPIQSLVETTAPVLPVNVCFGESIVNVKDLIMRDVFSKRISHSCIVDFEAPFADYSTFFSYFSLYYRFWRGSNALTVLNNGSSHISLFTVFGYGVLGARYTLSDNVPTSYNYLADGGSVLPFYSTAYSFPTFIFPFYRGRMFYPNIFHISNRIARSRTFGIITTDPPVVICERAADDYEYACPLGAPTLVYPHGTFPLLRSIAGILPPPSLGVGE
nr:MAG: RNA-dependent RNA polymerase [Avian associated picorna-like virus 43]